MELSGFEMVLIFLIALLVLGPEELIKHAVNAGRFIGKMRTQFNNFKLMTQDELVRRAELGDLKEITDIKEKVQGLGMEIDQKVGRIELSSPKVPEPESAAVASEVESDVEASLLKLGTKKNGGSA